MLRFVWELDQENKVKYFFVDTGLEMQATKDHIQYLQELYGIEIETIKPKIPCARSVKEHGYPFFSKQTAQYFHRAQINGFGWDDGTMDEIQAKYPDKKFQSMLRWWCNEAVPGEHPVGRTEIRKNAYLKEFVQANPPQFHISDMCCTDCKKEPLHKAEKDADLVITGIRKAEGGQRSLTYKSCFLEAAGGKKYDSHFPLFYWTDADKAAFVQKFGIVHSKAYTEYGFKRTGCAGCPFSSKAEQDLEQLEKYEPTLAKAVRNIFAPSYEYRRQYNEFKERQKALDRRKGQLSFDDLEGNGE